MINWKCDYCLGSHPGQRCPSLNAVSDFVGKGESGMEKKLKEVKEKLQKLPEVLILVDSKQRQQEISRVICAAAVKSENPFSLSSDWIRAKDVYIKFAFTETLNRGHESLFGHRFVSIFQEVDPKYKPTDKLLVFLTTRYEPETDGKGGTPSWLVNLLIGLNLM